MFLNLTTASPTYIPGVGTGAVWMWCGGASPCDLPERESARHFLASLLTAKQLPLVLTERQLAAQQRCQNG